jgi:hypothetical protein
MEKKSFANRFGLIALMLVSLFAATAFAGNAPAPQQVVVTNSPAQPVPMVGLVKDSDNPARQPFQWNGTFTIPQASSVAFKVTTVPANQRLVLEQISALCTGVSVTPRLSAFQLGVTNNWQWLPVFANGLPTSSPVRFYVDPGADFYFSFINSGFNSGSCDLTASGYYVNLP